MNNGNGKDGIEIYPIWDGKAFSGYIGNEDGTASDLTLHSEGHPTLPGLLSIRCISDDGKGGREEYAKATLQFALGPKTDGKWRVPGVTIEELVGGAVMRLGNLNDLRHCEENAAAIACFKEGLNHLRKRREDRAKRGVLGTQEE